ncbi:MAG: class I SAM-dependent methyltransferase [Micrococcales bacterium]|nr:class I SAM-dependent methyltransferase [Micrococcales bacterium]
MTPSAVDALATPAGQRLLAELPPYDPDLALTIAKGLRKRGVNPDLIAAALTQSRLAPKLAAKFGPFAQGMLATPDGVEQATRLEVATRHAARFRDAGLTHIADLTCGIGGDALAMAALGLRVAAFESDPITAAVARHNLRAFPEASVATADSLSADLDDVDAIWADPGRRRGATADGLTRRRMDPEACSPPLSAVLAAAAGRPLGVKLAPGIRDASIPADAEAQWVSHLGDVVEATCWFGPLRTTTHDGGTHSTLPTHDGGTHLARVDAPRAAGPLPVLRSALVLGPGGAASLTFADPSNPAPPLTVGDLDDYLLEPDGALICSGLIAEAARHLDRPRLLHPRIAYVSSPSRAPSSCAGNWAAFRVREVHPLNVRKVKARLRELGVGRLEIKQRGCDVVPDTLRQQLAPRGEEAATLIATRIAGRHAAIIADRAVDS